MAMVREYIFLLIFELSLLINQQLVGDRRVVLDGDKSASLCSSLLDENCTFL